MTTRWNARSEGVSAVRGLGKKAVWIAMSISGILFVGILFGPPILAAYDKANLTDHKCVVKSAREATASASAKGGGATVYQVRIETLNCGTLTLRKGVSADNIKDITSELRPDATYSFEVGAGTDSILAVLTFFGLTPEVYDYKPAK